MTQEICKQVRARALTRTQKQIILENRNLFAANIARLPGMEGTSVRQISDFLRQHPAGQPNPHEELADHIERYIREHGLPAKHGGVMGYIKYLRDQI
mgnify:CR=1 FL=1